MQSWLEAQKQPAAKPMEMATVAAKGEETVNMPSEEKREKIEPVLDLEINNRLLLKAKELWPLDPDIKRLPSE